MGVRGVRAKPVRRRRTAGASRRRAAACGSGASPRAFCSFQSQAGALTPFPAPCSCFYLVRGTQPCHRACTYYRTLIGAEGTGEARPRASARSLPPLCGGSRRLRRRGFALRALRSCRKQKSDFRGRILIFHPQLLSRFGRCTQPRARSSVPANPR